MDLLPEKYKFSHTFCFFLHDQIVDALKSGESANIFHHQVKMEPNEIEAIDGLKGDELLTWLENNGRKEIVLALYYKQICAALVSDMLHFIHEALQCSRKGKLTVSYALLRKPFKENLFYLEWLLGDTGGFLSRFDAGDIKKLSINTALTEQERIKIISKAIEETELGGLLSAEFLYELRFDKKSDFGFESYFQQANHLVTTFRFLETEGQNFNFVFSDEECRDSQWEHLYTYVPLLLYHANEVFEGILAKFATRKESFDLTSIRTNIGLAFWAKNCSLDFDHKNMIGGLREQLDSAGLCCDSCKSQIDFTDTVMLELYEDYSISCNHCDWKFDLWNMHEES